MLLAESAERLYLENYRSCSSPNEVDAAQHKVLDELQLAYEESRRGDTHLLPVRRTSCLIATELDNEYGRDLLVANPNHEVVHSETDSSPEPSK